MKYYILGDTGGHFQQLRKALLEIGLHDDYVLPDNVHIIHLGDVVHKGPDTLKTIQLVDTVMHKNPGQWTQIIGNHEAQYLGGINFWVENIDEEVVHTLRNWYVNDLLNFSYTLPAYKTLHTHERNYALHAPTVFTHAGITQEFFDQYLDNVVVEDFDKVIKSLSIDAIYRPGLMLGEDNNSRIGPVWAHGVHEVWNSWLNTAKFNQIVGHIAPYSWGFEEWFPGTNRNFISKAVLHFEEHFTIAPTTDDTFIGFMDPGYGKRAYGKVQPYIVID